MNTQGEPKTVPLYLFPAAFLLFKPVQFQQVLYLASQHLGYLVELIDVWAGARPLGPALYGADRYPALPRQLPPGDALFNAELVHRGHVLFVCHTPHYESPFSILLYYPSNAWFCQAGICTRYQGESLCALASCNYGVCVVIYRHNQTTEVNKMNAKLLLFYPMVQNQPYSWEY